MTRTSVRSALFVCASCGYESAKWLGRCTECGTWGSVAESALPAARGSSGRRATVGLRSVPTPIGEVATAGTSALPTQVSELDRVLGGGLVAGSVTLIGGEPGMGKSTLLMQALGQIAARGARCLLVCAEESTAQVRMRADRLGALAPELFVISETSLPAVLAHVATLEPVILAIDSIQAVHDPDAPGSAGSVAQVRDGAQELVRVAKENDIATLLVGHVTKDGGLAGPRALEHVVDTVLSFEGDRHHALRMLRALKHRFGATDELGLMEMTAAGLVPVSDPSALFLADRRLGATGSVVTAVMEGTRPLCVEVQSLVVPTGAPIPRRVAQAFEGNRLAMLVAVLQQRAGIALAAQDVYASVAGGVRVAEPAADLAVALAVAGARNDYAVDPDTMVIGEIGLGGEIRQVPQAPRRLAEALRLGFRNAIVPLSTPDVRGMNLRRVADLREALVAVAPGAG
ncbi:MAG TPA: DNA repair protein RadA [Acidimicrobiia bacterium]|nr:DNA repair protein RadA [Acidimicrobiia bacterium]